MEDVGLVLEGGGMRGLYTAGVLDFFLEKKLYFSYVIGVSAGACNATSYISKQEGRNKVVNTSYINDSRYLSYKSLLKGNGLFGMDFVFDKIPRELEPFDFESFYDYEGEFIVGTTDCMTGETIYFNKDDLTIEDDLLTVIRASSSLPFVAPVVEFKDLSLMDGGISDPIPIKKSIADGNEKNILILTRDKDYRKDPFKFKLATKIIYRNYNGLRDALFKRYQIYNQTMDYISRLEEEGEVFVIRPTDPLGVNRVERDVHKLKALYRQGYVDSRDSYQKLKEYIGI